MFAKKFNEMKEILKNYLQSYQKLINERTGKLTEPVKVSLEQLTSVNAEKFTIYKEISSIKAENVNTEKLRYTQKLIPENYRSHKKSWASKTFELKEPIELPEQGKAIIEINQEQFF